MSSEDFIEFSISDSGKILFFQKGNVIEETNILNLSSQVCYCDKKIFFLCQVCNGIIEPTEEGIFECRVCQGFIKCIVCSKKCLPGSEPDKCKDCEGKIRCSLCYSYEKTSGSSVCLKCYDKTQCALCRKINFIGEEKGKCIDCEGKIICLLCGLKRYQGKEIGKCINCEGKIKCVMCNKIEKHSSEVGKCVSCKDKVRCSLCGNINKSGDYQNCIGCLGKIRCLLCKNIGIQSKESGKCINCKGKIKCFICNKIHLKPGKYSVDLDCYQNKECESCHKNQNIFLSSGTNKPGKCRFKEKGKFCMHAGCKSNQLSPREAMIHFMKNHIAGSYRFCEKCNIPHIFYT